MADLEEKKRKSELNIELKKYISFLRKESIKKKFKKLLKKKKEKKEPVITEDDIPAERVEEVIREFPLKKSKETAPQVAIKKPFFKRFFKPKVDTKQVQELEEEFEEEIKELEEEEKKVQEKRKLTMWGFISKLNFLKAKQNYNVPTEEELEQSENLEEPRVTKVLLERPEIEEDIKKIALITQSIINRLPNEQIVDFKNSNDFLTYKELLKKYKLVKEKD